MIPDINMIKNLIFEVITELNEIRDADKQIALNENTVLFGKGGVLNSLGLVELIACVEQRLSDSGISVTIADERAMSQKSSPFRTPSTLSSYIMTIVGEKTEL